MKEMEYNYDKRKTSDILHEGECLGIPFMIINCRHDHPCAYLKVPEGSKYVGMDYTKIPLECHGGITYAGEYPLPVEDPNKMPKGYWIGWDYNHLGDFSAIRSHYGWGTLGKKWTTKEVYDELKEVALQFVKLLSEEGSNAKKLHR